MCFLMSDYTRITHPLPVIFCFMNYYLFSLGLILFHICLSLVPLAVLKSGDPWSPTLSYKWSTRLTVTGNWLNFSPLTNICPCWPLHQKGFAFWNWGHSLSQTRFHFRVTRQSKQDKLRFPQCQRRGSTKGCQSVLADHLLSSEGRCLIIPGDNSATILIGRRAQAMPPSAGSSSDRHSFQFLHF